MNETDSPSPDSDNTPNPETGELPTPPALNWSTSVALLDTAPGVDVRGAEMVLAEIGINMRQFPDENHLTAWGGLAPGNNQSGSKRKNAKTREGNGHLRQVMIQIAWAASRTKDSYPQAFIGGWWADGARNALLWPWLALC